MPSYVDASTQTVWAGLTKNPSVRPEILYTAPDTTTPPDEMITQKKQSLDLQPPRHLATSSLLERRGRPESVRRVSMPDGLDVEIAPSPPPTKALLSPLPENNRLHAGHTPMRLGSMSPPVGKHEQSTGNTPAQKDQSHTPDSPDEDPALKGALALPALPKNPMVGDDEHIALEALDERLSQLAVEQERFSKLRGSPELPSADSSEDSGPTHPHQESSSNVHDGEAAAPAAAQDHSRTNDPPVDRNVPQSTSDYVEDEIDGVRLKKTSLNFGEPMGQGPRRRSEPSLGSNRHGSG